MKTGKSKTEFEKGGFRSGSWGGGGGGGGGGKPFYSFSQGFFPRPPKVPLFGIIF